MEYGLVLAGGGVRGAYHVGVWQALREMRIKISAISGTSIGAVNGALFAQGDYAAARRLWEGISINDIVALPEGIRDENNLFAVKNFAEIFSEIYKNNGLDMSPLEELLRGVIDEDRLRKSPVDFGVAAFSLTRKSGVCRFKADIPQGKIIEYLMASVSMPGFKRKTIDADTFMDGAVSNNMPVNMMLDKDIENIITVDVKGIGVYKSFNLAGRNVISIKCAKPKTGIMEFDREGILRSINEGYTDCMKAFGRFKGDIYAFKTADYNRARGKYSEELIRGIECAASVFDIDTQRVYTVKALANLMMSEYEKYAAAAQIKTDSVFEKIRKADDNAFVTWLVKALESGGSDFIKEKMSVLGANYDAASAILYFKRQK
ncbi:MAG: patatin-like phospholipase family protein [Firmicutes bacterium]|nr:patatin-like phospholipase family protein [Bacillota bacterium]